MVFGCFSMKKRNFLFRFRSFPGFAPHQSNNYFMLNAHNSITFTGLIWKLIYMWILSVIQSGFP